jgi:hypothetical protein
MPLFERHTSLCSRRRRGRYDAPITVTRRDDGSTDLGVYGFFEVSSTCVLSFRDVLGILSIGFRALFADMKSRVGAMISR